HVTTKTSTLSLHDALPISKIAAGYTLDELMNPVTGKTYACFEPVIDYIVTKIPRWPFDKFESANRSLGTQMKATGEVMAIGRSLDRKSTRLNSSHVKISYA